MPEVSAEEKAAMLAKEANEIDSLLSAGDPDAALTKIGGIASAMSVEDESGQKDEADKKKEEQKQKEVWFTLRDADV